MKLQRIIRAIYPPSCVACDAPTMDENGLCLPCWGDTRFISGCACDACGMPLPGEDDGLDRILCDDCIAAPRPWHRGRAAILYHGTGRRLVMALKHGDRTDLAVAGARWMAARAAGIADADSVVVPVPLHWMRLAKRRYNQAALLSARVARHLGALHLPDALLRARATRPLEHETRADRMAALDGAIRPHPWRGGKLAGRRVLLIDDVMTSGATLGAATAAARQAGAASVDVLTLARVARDG